MRETSSTSVENALPPTERNPNQHHNIPQSRTGSNEENNISNVKIDRHDYFHHSWGSNALPTELIGYVSIHSIGLANKDKRLDATQVRELLAATRASDWKNYFTKDATTSAADITGVLRSLQNLRTTAHFLHQEMVWVRNTVAAIRRDGHSFPCYEHPLLQNSMKFFDAKTPIEVIEEFLNEKHGGELSWCKPLRYQKRNQIQGILNVKHGTPSNNRKEYVHVLLDHHKVLDLHAREIERTVTKLHHELQKVMQMSVLRPLDAA